MKKQNKVNLRLTLDVSYIPNGESLKRLMQRLDDLAQNASGAGMLTGEGPAEVDTWTCEVSEYKPIRNSTTGWLRKLEPSVAKKALTNYKNHTPKTRTAASLHDALYHAFGWGDSPEGFEFWQDVFMDAFEEDKINSIKTKL